RGGEVSPGPVPGSVGSAVPAAPQADPRLAAVTSPTYRRLARPRGPFARNTATPAVPPEVLPQLSQGSLQFNPGQKIQERVFAERLSPLPPSVATTTQADGQQDGMRGFAHQVSYPAGMLAPLAQLDQEALLPGASTIPPNTALILQPNPDQIAAYMVGLSLRSAGCCCGAACPLTHGPPPSPTSGTSAARPAPGRTFNPSPAGSRPPRWPISCPVPPVRRSWRCVLTCCADTRQPPCTRRRRSRPPVLPRPPPT